MKLVRFMDAAYQGKASGRKLKTRQGDMIFSLEDLADQVGVKPSRAEVEQFVPQDKNQLDLLISPDPGKKYALLWGYLTSLSAESRTAPLLLPCRDYVGLELMQGTIILQEAGAHVGERMKGGKIRVQGKAGDYLGQEMEGGGIVALGCRDYAFRNMRGGYGVVRGDGGKFTGLGNSGGRIVVQGSCGERAGWLMRSGSLYVRGDAGDYLGLLMSGGKITVRGKAARRAGWRKKGGSITVGGFGPEAADDVLGMD
jgi:formylmethanofuran dehydrogenase subunit C